ncbi:phosphatidate cytidylyltransferase [Synechococcus sp. UW140]|uniref:phosphatidate cytidylyltransferase n=1 Tax=Synechococcus sp. UW140 TaxID=368503 RepID=UPI000E0EBFA1|nr:phosphatidate cytidylyltransferase [Synechococcus sp. UW140]
MTMLQPVIVTFVVIIVILSIATVIAKRLRRSDPSDAHENLWLRLRTWWQMVGVFAMGILLGGVWSLLFFAFLSFLALKEFFSLIPTRRADRRVLFWAYMAIPLQFLWVQWHWYGMFLAFIPVFCFLLLPLRMLSIGKTDGYLKAAGTIQWGLMTTVFCLSHAAFLLILRLPDSPEQIVGPGLVMFLVVLTELNDIAQYIWGRSIGRNQIAPLVSPNKTRAGFIGGVTTTLLVGTLIGPWLTPLETWSAALAALIIGLGGFAGDLNISALKRDLGIKDSGTLLPGHGGILDRVDSLTYTAPLFFHFIYALLPWHTYSGAVWWSG